MKSAYLFSALVGSVAAFPRLMQSKVQPRQEAGCSVNSACDTNLDIPDSAIGVTDTPTPAQSVSRGRQNCGALNPCSVFDAEEQYVSTTGQYAYQSPGPGDIRGPCPGLNAAANHGYLPRSGVANLVQTIEGLGASYAMGADLSGFLAAYAIVIDGDLLTQTWSIGGPQSQLGGNILPGKAQGISWSHNKYEGDTSIARCDAYVNGGDAHSLSTTRFAYNFENALEDDRFTMDKFSQAFAKNTHRSIAQNPNYFAGALFSTTLVAPAAYNFVIAMMSNHTEQEVGGYLDSAIFQTFFAVEGEYPNFTWKPGQERIPDNWYRRPSATPYQAGSGVFGDLLSEFAAYPDSFRFGGNTNGVNTYEGIDLSNFTGGTYTADNIMQGNNFQCFIYQGIQQTLPDFLSAGTGSLTDSLNFLNPHLDAAFGGVACPSLSQFNDNNVGAYPGHTYSPDGPATNC